MASKKKGKTGSKAGRNNVAPLSRTAERVLGALTTVTAAVALLLSGLMIAMLPVSTSFMGTTFSNWDDDVYPAQTMEQIGSLARAYSFSGTGLEQLEDAEWQALETSWPNLAALAHAAPDASAGQKIDALFERAAQGGEVDERAASTFLLDRAAIEHLADCTRLFDAARIVFAVCALAAVICGALLRRHGANTALAHALERSAGAVFALACVLLAWVLIDFEGLFAAMHGLFFAEGTWLFPSDSLLIQLFPESFWSGMAGLWVVGSLVLSTVTLAAGVALQRRIDYRNAPRTFASGRR